MQVEQVTSAKGLNEAYGVLTKRLGEGAKTYRKKIGYQGGSVSKLIRWHPKQGFWFLIERGDYFWCPFGTQNPATHETLKITCEINSSRVGQDGRFGGIFWSTGGNLYLGHTGKVGGGRAGIGKTEFLRWYQETHGTDPTEGIKIGKLSSQRFLAALSGFVRAVEEFKEQAVNSSRVSDDEMDRDAEKAAQRGDFDETSIADARRKALRQINIRRGQPAFRNKLLITHGNRCAMSGCDCPEALEAAHIRPYWYGGDDANNIKNGILLRADLHTLFDLGKIGIDPNEFKIVVSQDLVGTSYSKLSGSKVRLPADKSHWPNKRLLKMHLSYWKLS